MRASRRRGGRCDGGGGGGCRLAWSRARERNNGRLRGVREATRIAVADVDDVREDIERAAAIRPAFSAGGNVIISFGGEAGGELAQTCTSVSSLTAAYKTLSDEASRKEYAR